MDKIRFGEGWYGEERTERFTFRWMGPGAVLSLNLAFQSGRKVLMFQAGHSFAGQENPVLEISAGGETLEKVEIRPEWAAYDCPLKAAVIWNWSSHSAVPSGSLKTRVTWASWSAA